MRILPGLLFLVTALSAAEKFQSLEWTSHGRSAPPFAFRAVGVYGSSDVVVRVSADGITWSEWQTAHPNPDGELLYFGELQRHIETDRPARVLLIDPGVTSRTIDKAVVRRAEEPPPIVKREDWGCNAQTCPPRGAPSYTNVTHLIVHHSAGSNSAADWAAVVRSIWVLHVQGNGWADIGYNYLIDPNGVLYEGRAGGDGVLGAHFSAVNTGTMGVCLLGIYSTTAPQTASIGTLQALLAWQARKWRIDAGGRSLHAASGLLLNNISGHRDAGLSPRASGTTECPGNGLYALLPQLRRDVRAEAEGNCPLQIDRPIHCLAPEAGAVSISAAIPEGCELTLQSGSEWIGSSLDGHTLRLSVSANTGSARSGSLTLNRQRIDVHQSAAGAAAQPCIDFGGIVSAASFQDSPLAPNGLFTVFGTNLSATEAAADSGSWPLQLAGVSVTVNDRPAPLGFVSAGQINAQLPLVGIGSARIVVRVGESISPERLLWVTEASPAIFAALEEEPGILSVYYTGAGRTPSPPAAKIGEFDAPFVNLSTAPGLPGVQRALFRMPANIAADAEVSLTLAGATSPAARIQR